MELRRINKNNDFLLLRNNSFKEQNAFSIEAFFGKSARNNDPFFLAGTMEWLKFFKRTNELSLSLVTFQIQSLSCSHFFNVNWMRLRRKFTAVVKSEKPGNKFFSLLFVLCENLISASCTDQIKKMFLLPVMKS